MSGDDHGASGVSCVPIVPPRGTAFRRHLACWRDGASAREGRGRGSPLPNQQTKGAAVVVVSASCSATLAIFLKFAYAAGANITTIISVRFVLAALFLLLWLKLRRIPVRLPLAQVLALCAMGAVGYGGMSLLFAIGLRFASASLAGMLLYTYPAIVHDPVGPAAEENGWIPGRGLALLICLGGLYLVPRGLLHGHPAHRRRQHPRRGLHLLHLHPDREPPAEAGGSSRRGRLHLRFHGDRLLGVRTGDPHAPGLLAADAGLGLHLRITLLPTFLASCASSPGIRLIGASRASIICTLEPFITVLLSCLLLKERISLPQVLGGVLIISGVLSLQFRARAKE